jgi:N-acyl-D-aspartate/D-glutamate deacylase
VSVPLAAKVLAVPTKSAQPICSRHWARDRDTGRLSVAEAVRELTSTPAKVAGLLYRGRIEVGYKADLNVIDHARAAIAQASDHPRPARGRTQTGPDGHRYVATIVSSQVIAERVLLWVDCYFRFVHVMCIQRAPDTLLPR